ncbi:MAG: histidinol dehydrogenase [Akkermansiaceae bacterium]|nr:histidinol dehydrogenase [Armatimonadota bacterium]
MRLYDLRNGADRTLLRAALADRLSPSDDEAGETVVRTILADVRKRGDDAVLEWTRRFDYAQATSLRVPGEAIESAVRRVEKTPLWEAMIVAANRIRSFHEKHKRESWLTLSTPGETMGQVIRPLSRVGIYVPGGTASYPSTVLMAAIPAQVAGVSTVAVATPPNRETGLPPDATLAAAHIAGVSEIYGMGGAQAIGALAFGTETVPPAVKIVGPGNRFVNLAKRLVYGVVGIDMLAGPSEVGIIADETASAETVAIEIIAQTEHDPLNSALFVTTAPTLAEAVEREIDKQLSDLPRADTVRAALKSFGYIALVDTIPEAIITMNDYAPEHLHLLVRDPWQVVPGIENAGAILIGEASAAAIGDYIAGPCHTLPTAGSARFSSPLNVDDFVKKTSIISFDKATAKPLATAAVTFAEAEGLEAHARSARHVLKL